MPDIQQQLESLTRVLPSVTEEFQDVARSLDNITGNAESTANAFQNLVIKTTDQIESAKDLEKELIGKARVIFCTLGSLGRRPVQCVLRRHEEPY